ncbi:MAG: hypothetical protein DRP81_04455, partial [Candidatus Omnitrophota bacterium]
SDFLSSGGYLPKEWKRIDFGYVSLGIYLNLEKLNNFLLRNKEDLKKRLSWRVRLLELAVVKLSRELVSEKEEFEYLFAKYQQEILKQYTEKDKENLKDGGRIFLQVALNVEDIEKVKEINVVCGATSDSVIEEAIKERERLKEVGNNEISLPKATRLNRLVQADITGGIKILKYLATRAPPKKLLSLKFLSFQVLITYLIRHEESHLKGLSEAATQRLDRIYFLKHSVEYVLFLISLRLFGIESIKKNNFIGIILPVAKVKDLFNYVVKEQCIQSKFQADLFGKISSYSSGGLKGEVDSTSLSILLKLEQVRVVGLDRSWRGEILKNNSKLNTRKMSLFNVKNEEKVRIVIMETKQNNQKRYDGGMGIINEMEKMLKPLGISEKIMPTLLFLINARLIDREELVTIIQTNINKTNDVSLNNYIIFIKTLKFAYTKWLTSFFKNLGVPLDNSLKETILREIIQNEEGYVSKGKSGLKIDNKGNPQIEMLTSQGKRTFIPLSDYVLRTIIESRIGGLNGRSTFVKYLLRQVSEMLKHGASGQEILMLIDRQYKFWSTILKDQLQKYDKVRDEKEGIIQRPYLFINYEFDDLFRYCEDPIEEFDLDLDGNLDSDSIQQLAERFKSFLDKNRKHLPKIQYPLSLKKFYFKAISFLLTHWKIIFAKTENETSKVKKAKLFWKITTFVWLILNLTLISFVSLNILNAPMIYLIPSILLFSIFIIAFFPISYWGIISAGRAYIGWREGKIRRIATVKNWKEVKKRFNSLWLRFNDEQKSSYLELINNLYEEYKLTDEEKAWLQRLDFEVPPRSEEAEERIKKWINKFYQKEIPSIESWYDVRSVTIQISSLDEKFFYHWEELINIQEEEQTESLLARLRKVYLDEWHILIERLDDKLTFQEKEILLNLRKDIITPKNPQVVSEIERWANLRLPTLFNTLEGARKVRLSYKKVAKKFFPDATEEELNVLINDKVQFLFLHDKYPTYSENNIQKQDIDNYLKKYPFIQLLYPEDIIHQSKYGAWANALSKVKGEALFTLDSDHSIRQEEVDFLPNVLKEFTLNPNLAGVQYKLYAWNEPFSIVTKCVGLAENSWWGLDLRVKDKLGATGLYGHLVFRTEFLKSFEGLQDDSVAEDILTSVQFLKEGFDTKYVEYLQIGKGFNVTYPGMRIPYRRYPAGAIESGLSKPFIEFLLSDKLPWNIKLETLFMLSYYPTQIFIILGTVAYIMGVYFFSFNPYTFLPAIFLIIGWILAEAINLEALIYMIENHGLIKGITKYFKTFPILAIFYVSFIPHYYECVKKALKGYAKFIVTRISGIISRESWKNIYINNKCSIQLGSLLVTIIILIPFQLFNFIVSILFILNSFIWLIAPFIFNPAKNKIEKLKDLIIGPIWALVITYYEVSIGAIRKYFLLRSIKKYMERKDVELIDNFLLSFQNLLKDVVGKKDFDIIKILWDKFKKLLEEAEKEQKIRDNLKQIKDGIDGVVSGKLKIEDLEKEYLFERIEDNLKIDDGKFTQLARAPPNKVKICLINLFSPEHPVLVRPLSIEVLAGDLYQIYGSNVQIKLFDLQLSPLDSVIKEIENMNPHIIGLSVRIGSLKQMEEVLKRIKSLPIFKEKVPLIVLGNVVPTFTADVLLKKYKDAIIVIGEGELTMRDLVKKMIEDDRDYSDVPNLAYMKNGKIVYTKREYLDLSKMALPLYESVPEILRRDGHIWVEASRGCNGHCTFCSRRPIRNTGWQPIPVEKVIEDIKNLYELGVRHFRFTDDEFMGVGSKEGLEHAKLIAEGVKKLRLRITFDISTRVDSLYSKKYSSEEIEKRKEIFKLLKEAGLTQVFLGIESGCDSQLKRYGKGVSAEENKKAIEIFRELDIQVVAGFIIIDYLMDLEELKKNIKFLKEMKMIGTETAVFVSDLISTLRAQEGCVYKKMLARKGLLKERDETLVSYKADYLDRRVKKIVEVIEKWRKEQFSLIYALKNEASLSSMRKEVSLERDLLEYYLQKFKLLDVNLIEELIELLEKIEENIDEIKVFNLINNFKKRREEIIKRLKKEIEKGNIKDDEGILIKEVEMRLDGGYRVHKRVLGKVFKSLLLFFLLFTLIRTPFLYSNTYSTYVNKFLNWIEENSDKDTGLSFSHIGDERFKDWTITYDSAVVTLAYIATGKIKEAERIMDFYMNNQKVWRLGGIIEAICVKNPVLGEDWSVRAGSNLWIGIASFHLYKKTKKAKYLMFAKKIADFAIFLQNKDEKNFNFGGIRLGPKGEGRIACDQHLGWDVNQPSFWEVYATEHNIDAYALFNMLYQETKEKKYKEAKERVLNWLKRVGFNRKESRFNRGTREGKYGVRIDKEIATDVHSWAISALGPQVLNKWQPDLAEKVIKFVEENCLVEVKFIKPDGEIIKVKGVDFISKEKAKSLNRPPIVSPEWTFQLINAYRRMEDYYKQRKNFEKMREFKMKREDLVKNMLRLAIQINNSLTYPYATLPEVAIGHEFKTPKKGNLSVIGVAWAIMVLKEFDPLVFPERDLNNLSFLKFNFLFFVGVVLINKKRRKDSLLKNIISASLMQELGIEEKDLMHTQYELAPLKLKGGVREPTKKELENLKKYLDNNEISLAEATRLNRLVQADITGGIKILKYLATRAPPKKLLSLKSLSFQALINYLIRHEESHLKGLNEAATQRLDRIYFLKHPKGMS